MISGKRQLKQEMMPNPFDSGQSGILRITNCKTTRLTMYKVGSNFTFLFEFFQN